MSAYGKLLLPTQYVAAVAAILCVPIESGTLPECLNHFSTILLPQDVQALSKRCLKLELENLDLFSGLPVIRHFLGSGVVSGVLPLGHHFGLLKSRLSPYQLINLRLMTALVTIRLVAFPRLLRKTTSELKGGISCQPPASPPRLA